MGLLSDAGRDRPWIDIDVGCRADNSPAVIRGCCCVRHHFTWTGWPLRSVHFCPFPNVVTCPSMRLDSAFGGSVAAGVCALVPKSASHALAGDRPAAASPLSSDRKPGRSRG